MALADERVAKALEIGVKNFQTARIVGAEGVIAANDMERRPLLRTRLGDEQCALRAWVSQVKPSPIARQVTSSPNAAGSAQTRTSREQSSQRVSYRAVASEAARRSSNEE